MKNMEKEVNHVNWLNMVNGQKRKGNGKKKKRRKKKKRKIKKKKKGRKKKEKRMCNKWKRKDVLRNEEYV